jgi:carboxyl-terminal processing protease
MQAGPKQSNILRISKIALALKLFAFSSLSSAQQADFNEVGKQMSIMLQNSHFARLPFNTELSHKFFEEYLEDLDTQKLYFTQLDIDGFREKYGDKLHTMLLRGDGIKAATEIYAAFKERAIARISQAQELLESDFEFNGTEKVMLSRKEAKWPKTEAEAKEAWGNQIKEAVLSEVLRREMIAKLAKEQNKPDPSIKDLDPRKKISLRYKRLLASIVDVDDEDVANFFLSAVSRTYDPHTDYMSFREMNRFKGDMKNELIGIGALLQAEEDGATIIKGIVVGGPADKEGKLKLNDRVVAVDSLNTGTAEGTTDIMFMKIDKVVELIRGKEGTSVALKVEPAGGAPGQTEIITIKREKVELKDEQASGEIIKMKQDDGKIRKIGVITLPSFYSDFDDGEVRCSNDVENILKKMIEEKIDGLLFDLRNNGGGSLEEVRRMTGFFVPSGPVVQVKSTLGPVKVMNTDSGEPLYNGPMVVVIDKSSASASEILAGALQDFNRAVIVGDSSTFGKGTVQQPMDIGRMLPLFSNRDQAGYLKVTIQKFYRPSGSSTQMEGVVPNITLPSIMDALDIGEAHLDNALPHERIRPAANFKAADAQALFIPKLKELSQKRVEVSQDFSYVIEDIMKAKERLKDNHVSLNKSEREKEIAEADAQKKQRNAERLERFKTIAAQDKNSYTFYKITLDGLDKNEELKAYDPSAENGDYMRRAVDETASLDDTPKWPSNLSPDKREAIHILKDLVEVSESAKAVGALGSEKSKE